MRIAISATGTDLAAEVDPRFGRCSYFIIIDPQTMEYDAIENRNAMTGGGAGISTAQRIANNGIEVVLTGNCGPNAYQTLSASGIQIITGVSGKVEDAVRQYKSGELQAGAQPNVEAHFGMGRDMGIGMNSMEPPTDPISPEQEIGALKNQAQMLGQQLGDIQHRIENLEKKNR
jgi:predicted Fe-Mo cluster-binding NifX family protein